MTPAEPGAPARWSADFWVHDVDEAVARAEASGGSVASPAADTPVGRQAVLTDPQGVSFSVSKVSARG